MMERTRHFSGSCSVSLQHYDSGQVGVSQMALVVKNLPANVGDIGDAEFDPWVRKIPWRRARQPTPVFLPQKSHGQGRLVGYGPWGRKELDTTEWLSTHTENCTTVATINLRIFCHPQGNPIPVRATSRSPLPPQALDNQYSTFCHYRFGYSGHFL